MKYKKTRASHLNELCHETLLFPISNFELSYNRISQTNFVLVCGFMFQYVLHSFQTFATPKFDMTIYRYGYGYLSRGQ